MGQDNQDICIHEITDHRRQRIVVSEADFLDQHRVIFIDDGDHVVLQQGQQGVTSIEVACAGAQVLMGQKNLRHLLLKDAKQTFIRPDQITLPNRPAAC